MRLKQPAKFALYVALPCIALAALAWPRSDHEHATDEYATAAAPSRAAQAARARALLDKTARVPGEPAAPPGIRPGPPRVGSLQGGDDDRIGSRAECVACLESECAEAIAAGGDVEAARCLVPCVRSKSEAACASETYLVDSARGRRQSVCPGLARAPATMALVQCGLDCPCPDGRGEGDPEPGEIEARSLVTDER